MQFYSDLTAPICKTDSKSKAVFDDSKVTDHHAIIPTEVQPSSSLRREEKLIYDLIAKRFIAVFYPECKISNTLVRRKVGNHFQNQRKTNFGCRMESCLCQR